MKKERQSVAIFTLAILSLLSIGVILAAGAFKDKLRTKEKTQGKLDILGEMTQIKNGQVSSVDVNRLFQEATQDTKEVVSQKITEVEKAISDAIQKEISNLTQSQLKALQLQICKDWGVITPAPTTQP